LRKELYGKTEDADMRALLRGTRWFLLKNAENLYEKKGERERLEKALEANRPLMAAYYLKEELHRIWEQPDLEKGEEAFDRWLRTAEESEAGMLKRFAQTMKEHRRGIVNYYGARITAAALEGTNGKIRVLQRRAYGIRDEKYLELKIYALHETKTKNIA
jgi:transposase